MTAAVAEPTLTEALLAAGYRHEKGRALYKHRVYRISDGALVGERDASESWAWLAAGCPATMPDGDA